MPQNFDIGRKQLKSLLSIGGIVSEEGAFVVNKDEDFNSSVGCPLQHFVQPRVRILVCGPF